MKTMSKKQLKEMADELLRKTKKRKKKKKRKFKRPATGLRPQGPVSQISHVGVRYHKGFVYDKLRYTILTGKQISEVDRDLVDATLKTITTGPEAMSLPTPDNGWSCKVVDGIGRILVVSYIGIEVSMFYKRQLTEIKLEPGDHHPEGVLQDPEEAWQRLDLLGHSAKQANVVIVNVQRRLEQENKLLMTRVNTLQELNDKLDEDNRNLTVGQQRLSQRLRELSKPTTKPKKLAKSSQNAKKTMVRKPKRSQKRRK